MTGESNMRIDDPRKNLNNPSSNMDDIQIKPDPNLISENGIDSNFGPWLVVHRRKPSRWGGEGGAPGQ